jgi:hypothetical protein
MITLMSLMSSHGGERSFVCDDGGKGLRQGDRMRALVYLATCQLSYQYHCLAQVLDKQTPSNRFTSFVDRPADLNTTLSIQNNGTIHKRGELISLRLCI